MERIIHSKMHPKTTEYGIGALTYAHFKNNGSYIRNECIINVEEAMLYCHDAITVHHYCHI